MPPPTELLAGLVQVPVLLPTQFAYVFDHSSQAITWLSSGVETLLGARPDAGPLDPAWFAELVHPDDAVVVARAQALLAQYLHERPTAPLPHFQAALDYRVRHAQGHYLRVLHHTLLLERAPGPGPVLRSLALFTDITAHKRTHDVRGHVNQPDFPDFAAQRLSAVPALTRRERQVLALVVAGLTSRQIAHRLGLGEGTIKTHRRNIQRKVGTRNLHTRLEHLPPDPAG